MNKLRKRFVRLVIGVSSVAIMMITHAYAWSWVYGTSTSYNGQSYSYSPNYANQLTVLDANYSYAFQLSESHDVFLKLVQYAIHLNQHADVTWSATSVNGSFTWDQDVDQSYTSTADILPITGGTLSAQEYVVTCWNNVNGPVSYNFYIYADPNALYSSGDI